MTALAVSVLTQELQSAHKCLNRHSKSSPFVTTARDCQPWCQPKLLPDSYTLPQLVTSPICHSSSAAACSAVPVGPHETCCTPASACSCTPLLHDQLKSFCLHAECLQELCAHQRLLHHWAACHPDVPERHQGQHRAGKLCPREQLHLKGRANC